MSAQNPFWMNPLSPPAQQLAWPSVFVPKLFEALLAELKEKGIRKLFLEVEHDNGPAIALYEKFGFAGYGYRRDYYGKGKDAVLMSLELC